MGESDRINDPSNDPWRIDVHHHAITDVFRDLLLSQGITGGAGEELAHWSEDDTLAMMDRQGIRASVLSYTTSGMDIDDPAFLKQLARESNEALAEVIHRRPDRFGGFAFLPLPDVDASLEEIAYALDVLHLDGVGIHSNAGGLYPGDPAFEPLFAELNRRGTAVHLHPTDIPAGRDMRPQYPPYIVEFMFETTRAVAGMVYSGVMERYADMKIILSHAGATVPFLAWRLMTGEFTIPDLKQAAPAGVFEYLRRFYYDTAMAAHPTVFGSLKELAPMDHILFGTDSPYMPELAVDVYRAEIDGYEGFSSDTKTGIYRDHALQLFPRFK